MNAISLYVSTSRIILHNDPNASDQRISDLYRLVPYLRQSMSCAVCGRLLKDPFSPKEAKCQHNVCRLCVRGRKNVRPVCNSCKDCQDFRTYEENKQMRILLQCYKSMCEHVMSTALYSFICKQTIQTSNVVSGVIIPNLSLVELIEEGANFEDIFVALSTELPKTFTRIMPTVVTSMPEPSQSSSVRIDTMPQLPIIIKQEFPIVDMTFPMAVTHSQAKVPFLKNAASPLITTNVSTTANPSIKFSQINKAHNFVTQTKNVINTSPVDGNSIVMSSVGSTLTHIRNAPPIKTVSNGTAMYSVLYTGIGNKITIKRKTGTDEENSPRKAFAPALFRQITKQNSKRRGCRCGNATATPGKLTCCGQRCPCYVDSKSCINCKCRGCRNPHRPDGGKVRPIIPELACYEIHMADDSTNLNNSDIPIAKNLINNVNNLTPALPHKKTSKEYSLRDFSLNSRIRVTPLLTNTNTVSQRSPAFHTPQQSLNQTQCFPANSKVQRDQSLLKLENLSKESLLFQSSEGKYQVVNVFTSTSPQNQRIHSIAHSSSGNTFILPNNNQQNSRNIHQIPEINTTLPQIIMQQQSQSLPQSSKPEITTTAQISSYSHNKVITVHTVNSNNVTKSKNSTVALSTTPASLALSPIIVTSPTSFTTELFQDDDFLPHSHVSTENSPLPIAHPPLLEVVDTSEF